MNMKTLLVIFCAAFVLQTNGCQRKATRPIGVVRGRVTVNGQPVTRGAIIFENGSLGVSTSGPLEADGKYAVRTYLENGLPVGKYQVAVSPRQVVSEGVSIVGQDTVPSATPSATIPEKYRTITSTPLTAEVREGDNPPFDFDLNDK